MNCAHTVAFVLLRLQPEPYDPSQYSGGGGMSFLLMLLQTMLALALVCGLAYTLFRWVLPRLQVTRSANRLIRIVDRVGLDARKSLFVIEVGGRWLLVAGSEAGVQLVSELDADALQGLVEKLDAAPARGVGVQSRAQVAERFARILNRKK